MRYFIAALLVFGYQAVTATPLSGGQIHQTANWLGEVQRDEVSKKFQIVVIHQLRNTDLPESTGWVKLTSPLKIKLFKKNAMKEVVATRYHYEHGCDSFPIYELQTEETLDPKEWIFAAPENKSVRWAADNITFARTKIQPIGIADIPAYEWERLFDKLSNAVASENPEAGRSDLIAQIRKQGIRSANGLRTDKFLSLGFANLEFSFSGNDKRDRTTKKMYSVHRAYRRSPTGGLDEVASPDASGQFWDESYAPNQAIYLNVVDGLNLALRIDGSLQRSLYFLTNFHGVPLEHNFSLGPESCH